MFGVLVNVHEPCSWWFHEHNSWPRGGSTSTVWLPNHVSVFVGSRAEFVKQPRALVVASRAAACIFALQARVHPDRVHVFYFLHELSSVTVHNIYTMCVRLLCTVGVCHHHLVVAHTHCAEVTDICLSLPHTHVARVVTCVQVDALKPTCVVST